ncbi:MAG: sigma factor-like helix-turn-helix DNA-binding protein, partial [Alphaproteobacteria bacterium]|nr:sigma factor-like helix-turn-helix DNA-binding protein [Alphaproteobacteria bacterium]
VELLEAFHFEGKSVAEIAAEHGVSERAVEGRLRRARAKLRKKLDRILQQPVESRGRATTGGNEDARQT